MQLYPASTPYRLTHLSPGSQLALEQGFATTMTEKDQQSHYKRFIININTHFKIRNPRLDCIFNPKKKEFVTLFSTPIAKNQAQGTLIKRLLTKN